MFGEYVTSDDVINVSKDNDGGVLVCREVSKPRLFLTRRNMRWLA